MSRSTRTMWKVFAAVVVVALLGAACGGEDGDEAASATGVAGQANAPAAAPQEEGFDAAGGGERAATLPSIGPSVIKTARVELKVGDDGLEEAIEAATSIAGRYGGFVHSTRASGDERRSGAVVLRVPSERFEAALTDVRDLGEPRGETISGEDVSEEFVDLEARLRNLETQEAVMLDLMRRARSVGATVRVQNELSAIQLEKERIEGRLRFLRDQTDFGTISIAFTEIAPPFSEPGLLGRAWENARETTVAVVSGLVLAGGFALPFAVLALVALMAFRLIRPRFVRNANP